MRKRKKITIGLYNYICVIQCENELHQNDDYEVRVNCLVKAMSAVQNNAYIVRLCFCAHLSGVALFVSGRNIHVIHYIFFFLLRTQCACFWNRLDGETDKIAYTV